LYYAGVNYRWVLLLLALAAAGCAPLSPSTSTPDLPGTMTVDALSAVAVVVTPPATETLPPPVEVVVQTPTELPAFAPLSPEEVAAKAATAAFTPTPEPPTPIPPTSTASPTPPPTFTPPALPNTPPWEHYWFRRPVAVDNVLWTNKHYPYGSTRGGQIQTHHGVEFDVARGTEILAVASGTVIVAGDDLETAYGPHTDFYGNLVILQHDPQLNGQPVYTLYAHLTSPLVVVGQRMDAEQPIGVSGATGVADGPHMHFEVRVGQNSYDATRNPLLWLYPFPDRGTVAGRVVWADGSLAYEAPISLRRIDGEAPSYTTTSYADDSVNADEGWDENFALDDVFAGYYEITVEVGQRKIKQEFWVYPYQTSFVEIVID
jgi:murein DD-endopeptidase MepM/ murein hydrolase activator NlpD